MLVISSLQIYDVTKEKEDKFSGSKYILNTSWFQGQSVQGKTGVWWYLFVLSTKFIRWKGSITSLVFFYFFPFPWRSIYYISFNKSLNGTIKGQLLFQLLEVGIFTWVSRRQGMTKTAVNPPPTPSGFLRIICALSKVAMLLMKEDIIIDFQFNRFILSSLQMFCFLQM